MVFFSFFEYWAADGASKRKTAFVPLWDKSRSSFCDTTQIDACASTRFTHHHACPMDNGWDPVGIY